MYSNDLQIIFTELNKDKKYKKLIAHINSLKEKDIISILTSKRSVLDSFPKSLILYFEKQILNRYLTICEKCCISDLDLLSKIIEKSKRESTHFQCSRDILLNTKFRPEFLYRKFPNYFSVITILNFSNVALEESFILSLKDFVKHVNSGFFMVQPITKNILFRVNWLSSALDADRFYDCLSKSIEQQKAILSPEVLYKKRCINKDTVVPIIKYYELPDSSLKYAFDLIRDNTEHYEFFLKNQHVTKKMINKYNLLPYIHFYLAHNKYCTDEELIHYHRTHPELNWIYVHTNINLSKHQDYCKYLLECGEKSIVDYNLTTHLKNKKSLHEPLKLLELGLCKNAIINYIKEHHSELEIGLHI